MVSKLSPHPFFDPHLVVALIDVTCLALWAPELVTPALSLSSLLPAVPSGTLVEVG